MWKRIEIEIKVYGNFGKLNECNFYKSNFEIVK